MSGLVTVYPPLEPAAALRRPAVQRVNDWLLKEFRTLEANRAALGLRVMPGPVRSPADA